MTQLMCECVLLEKVLFFVCCHTILFQTDMIHLCFFSVKSFLAVQLEYGVCAEV